MKPLFRLAFIALLIVVFPSMLRAQDPVNSMNKKAQDRLHEIRMKDQNHQKRILDKFNEFYQSVAKMAPELKLQMPMHPGYTEQIKYYPDDVSSSKSKGRSYFAYVAEPYRLRSGPRDNELKNSFAVKRGTRVRVLMMPDVKKEDVSGNVTRKWVLVKTANYIQGYIPVDLLLSEAPSGEGGRPALKSSRPMLRSDLQKKMEVTADSLNVRSEPNSESNRLDMLSRGTLVDVLEYSEHTDYIDGRDAKWAKIRYSYLEGWVFSAYLGEPGASRPSGRRDDDVLQDFSNGQKLFVKSDILRVRDSPGNDGTVLFSLKNRDRIEVTEVQDELLSLAGRKSRWLGIRYNDYEGWVFGAFLDVNSGSYLEGDEIDRQFIFPFNDPNIPVTSNYGWRTLNGRKNYHKGVDLGARSGTPVLAAADGTVILVREDYRNCSSCGYGCYVIMQHNNGHRSLYGHLSAINVTSGQKLSSGEQLGKCGNTGHSYGAHLHFEILAYEEYVDPSTYIHASLFMVHSFLEHLAFL